MHFRCLCAFLFRLSGRVKYCYRALYRCSHISQANIFHQYYFSLRTVATVSMRRREEKQKKTRRKHSRHNYTPVGYGAPILHRISLILRRTLISFRHSSWRLYIFFLASIVLALKNEIGSNEVNYCRKKNFSVNDVPVLNFFSCSLNQLQRTVRATVSFVFISLIISFDSIYFLKHHVPFSCSCLLFAAVPKSSCK